MRSRVQTPIPPKKKKKKKKEKNPQKTVRHKGQPFCEMSRIGKFRGRKQAGG
jgi:hypothetical protein